MIRSTVRLFLPCMILFSSCGYRIDGPESGRSTITVPYVVGDSAGQLTNELVRMLSASGAFECVQNNGQYVLKVIVFSDGSDRIGYRYDRKDLSGKLKKNLMPVEGRRMISAEVSLINSATEEVEVGPVIVTADADYDYIDSDNLREVSMINSKGRRQSTISFSLGQLDSIEGAQDDVAVPLYRHLAQKIVDGMIIQKW
ncbi:MAG TPA: hypothetical protein VLG49_01905 [Rhabdochlamydiaceae bacterium]|nr:hypothetical protein [Rhabdochlamydiaceae bacterium]